MSTTHVRKDGESDILSVIRELENSGSPKASGESRSAEGAKAPDPAKLLESLQEKRKLIGLIDGYANVSGIDEMKAKLNDAIADLEVIIEAT